MNQLIGVAVTLLAVSLTLSVYVNITQNNTTSNLSAQMTTFERSITNEQYVITSLNTELGNIQEHTTALTMTQTLTLTQTITQTSTTAISVYPVPGNVTLAFTQVSGTFDYQVTVGGVTSTGSTNQAFAIPLKNLFQGEQITAQATTTASIGCDIGETVTVQLYVAGSVAAQSVTQCTGSPASLTYTV